MDSASENKRMLFSLWYEVIAGLVFKAGTH